MDIQMSFPVRATVRPTPPSITRHTFCSTVCIAHTHCQLEGVRNQWNSGRCRCSYDAPLWHLDLRVSDNGTMYAFSLSFFIDFGISLKSTCLEINNTVACPVRVHFAPRESPSPSTIDQRQQKQTNDFNLFVIFDDCTVCPFPSHGVCLCMSSAFGGCIAIHRKFIGFIRVYAARVCICI